MPNTRFVGVAFAALFSALLLVFVAGATAHKAGWTITSSIENGTTVSGTVTWSATYTTSTRVSFTDFFVDGVSKGHVTTRPPSIQLNTTTLSDGMHVFQVRGTASDGHTVSDFDNVNVSNAPPPPPPPTEPPPIAGQGYSLVFEDNFDGTALDLTKWSLPWFGSNWGTTASDAQVSNGILHLTSRRSEGYKNMELNSVDLSDSNPMRSWTYGYFETRSKWPVGRGNWSAFWLNNLHHQQQSTSPYACPELWSEIDVYENIWSNPETQWTTLHRNTNGRCGIPDERRPDDNHRWMRCDTATVPCDLTAGFHKFAVEWTPTRVKWYRDDQLVCSTRYNVTNTDGSPNCADVAVFDSTNTPMFLNLWLHPCDWAGTPVCPDATTPDVVDHQFDWVRVYQKP